MDKPITSFRNPYIKFIRSLKLKKYRDKEKRFFIEGIRIVAAAAKFNAPVESLIFCPAKLESLRAIALVESLRKEGIKTVSVEEDLFGKLSERENPQGIGAVVRQWETRLDQIVVRGCPLIVAIDGAEGPGNLGTVIRTADGAGASGVIASGQMVDLYNPATIRSSMGSFFSLPVVTCKDRAKAFKWLKDNKIAIVATSPNADVCYFDTDYTKPTAILMGNEAKGLDKEALEGADIVVKIPMAGSTDSLNVAAASAAVIYEAVRQRLKGRQA